MNTLKQDISDKYHGNIAKGARRIGISRQSLYVLIDKLDKGEKLRLSSCLLLARVMGLTYPQFQKKYLTGKID